MTDLYATMEPIVDRFQGHLDKYTGDVMMCEFGVPHHQDHHALRAALSAYFMLRAAERKNFSWKIRLGVATGSGYPHGKTGDQIPLGARIAAVADGYSALTRWRPHRAPGNRDAALGTLYQAAGAGRYDPRVVQALGVLLAGKENGGSSAQIAGGA